MKRYFTLLMTLILLSTLLLPQTGFIVYAEKTEGQKADTSQATEETTETSMEKEKETANKTLADSYKVTHIDGGPDLSAESAVLMDAASGAVLYGKRMDVKRYPASITKTLTALITIENCDMDEIVTFSNEAVNGVEGSSAGINVGAQMTVEDALYAMMLVSANEAAAALAEHIAGSVEAFADMMNAKADELGCEGSHFKNPHGLPDEDHYTTAHDMGRILQAAMQYDQFRKVAETITYTIEKNDTLNNSIELWNHSKILRENSEYYYKYAEGSKTGYTRAALNTLVTYAKKGDVELICVILRDYGADSSYHDTADLFRWGFDKVKGIRPLSEVKLKSLISEAEGLDETKKESYMSTKAYFDKDYYILVPKKLKKEKLKVVFTADEDKDEKRMGYLVVHYGDKEIGKAPVTYEGSLAATDVTKGVDGSEDGLETAPNSDTSLRPHLVFAFLIKLVAAIALIVLIMTIIRLVISNRDAKRKLERRKRARSARKKDE